MMFTEELGTMTPTASKERLVAPMKKAGASMGPVWNSTRYTSVCVVGAASRFAQEVAVCTMNWVLSAMMGETVVGVRDGAPAGSSSSAMTALVMGPACPRFWTA